MTRKSETHDPEWYLRDPSSRKCLVQCVGCQKIGYRADAPDQFFGRSLVVKHLGPLILDAAGLCDDCRTIRSDR